MFGESSDRAPRPETKTRKDSALRVEADRVNFDRPVGPAPVVSEEAQDERDVKEAVGELRAQRRLTKTSQDKFITSGELDTMGATNPMFKKAGRKSRRKSRKSKKVSQKRK